MIKAELNKELKCEVTFKEWRDIEWEVVVMVDNIIETICGAMELEGRNKVKVSDALHHMIGEDISYYGEIIKEVDDYEAAHNNQ
ncbi:MAG: hypothetical protein PHX08_06660 [Lachnospiraceae bacterium]|nr:hypothetical protein [Lachnospiraceae bacterium]